MLQGDWQARYLGFSLSRLAPNTAPLRGENQLNTRQITHFVPFEQSEEPCNCIFQRHSPLSLSTIFPTFLSTGWRCLKDSVIVWGCVGDGTHDSWHQDTARWFTASRTRWFCLAAAAMVSSLGRSCSFHVQIVLCLSVCVSIYLSNLLNLNTSKYCFIFVGVFIGKQSITRCFSGSQCNVCVYTNGPNWIREITTHISITKRTSHRKG